MHSTSAARSMKETTSLTKRSTKVTPNLTTSRSTKKESVIRSRIHGGDGSSKDKCDEFVCLPNGELVRLRSGSMASDSATKVGLGGYVVSKVFVYLPFKAQLRSIKS
ncbi:hypothetical protein SSX86_007726 [Deinandra increscens subsp. villosa]|uniref:Uncharacterized protein n=1 Tax=Deinandra increscens subsp. villosa TaxID=3103831 RepID=A0AAP0DIL2_9ASTR